eukprot:3271878-Prymnesium_polylepis.1
MTHYFYAMPRALAVIQHPRLPPIASHRSPCNHTPLRLTCSPAAHAHTRRIVDEHEASRRLGLTFRLGNCDNLRHLGLSQFRVFDHARTYMYTLILTLQKSHSLIYEWAGPARGAEG